MSLGTICRNQDRRELDFMNYLRLLDYISIYEENFLGGG